MKTVKEMSQNQALACERCIDYDRLALNSFFLFGENGYRFYDMVAI